MLCNIALLLQIRLKTLLDTCTYVVFNYTRRGLFDRDKLIVLTLLTFHIMLKVSSIYQVLAMFISTAHCKSLFVF